MKYDLLIRYHARAFLPGGVVYPAALPAELAQRLVAGVWMSQAVQQIEMPRALAFQRGRLVAPGGEWVVDLPGQSIDLTYGSLQAGLDLKQFCEKAGSYLSAMTEACGEKCTRLALVQEGILAIPVEEAHARLLRLPPMFQKAAPSEWDWRCSATIARSMGASEEDTNTIVTVKRMKAIRQDTGESLDRIRLDLDINTVVPVSGEPVPRFGREEVEVFFANSPTWHESVASEILSFLGVVTQ